MNQVQLEQAIKRAAYQIYGILEVFKNEDAGLRQVLEQSVFTHVQQLRSGEKVNIEGEGLVNEVMEPAEPARAEQINTPETDQGEGSEAV